MSASGYLDEARHRQLLAEYPLGPAFLDRLARLRRDELEALQDRRFRAVVRRAWAVPFYRRLWGARGIEPGDIQGLADIEKLPPFSKADLVQSVADHPPFGDYHGVDLAAGDRPSLVLHTTSGTTGAPQPVFFGAWDREAQNVLLARAYLLQGLQADDVVHSVYGFGMVNGGHYVREALLHFTRAIVLPAGTGLETRSEQQIELMRAFGATVIVGFADYIKRLAGVARERGVEPGRDIRIRMISGQVGQEDRNAISAAWGGAQVYDWYGVADTGIIAAEGPDLAGLLVWEDAHYLEVIDPDTARPRPAGEPGNLCVTALYKDGVYPIVRLDTHDVSSFLPGPPDRGLAFRRISGFQGRSDQMIKLRGINVYPTAIGTHLGNHPALTGEFVCRAERRGPRDELTVLVEVRAGADRPDLQRELAGLLRQKLGVEVNVELVSPGSTASLTGIDARQKPVRLIDRRRS